MIGMLRGQVAAVQGNTLLLDVNGVGYELLVTQGVLSGNCAPGAALELTVFTDVKENAIVLFGFSGIQERQVFVLLKRVKGVGSRIALNIVSALHPEQLLAAIALGDVNALLSVQGIGRKMAERLVVELREHVRDLLDEGMAEAAPLKPASPKSRSARTVSRDETSRAGTPQAAPDGKAVLTEGKVKLDVLMALEKLGFSRDRADSALRHALEVGVQASDAGELLRGSLAHLR